MAKKKISKKKTASRSTSKKAASKKTASKKTASKKTTTRKVAKKASAKATETAAPAPKVTKAKKTRSKKAPVRKAKCGPGKSKGKCASPCSKGTCTKPQLDGRSLIDRARDCKDLEECRKFIIEFNDAVEQSYTWLDEMHTQALSAEQTRDLYGEQISDLLEAIEIDRTRIAELEADLKKTRAQSSKSAPADAVLAKLAELRKEVRTLRVDLERLLEGRAPTSERRQRIRKAQRVAAGEGRGRGRRRSDAPEANEEKGRGRRRRGAEPMEGRPTRRSNKPAGPFAKYSVLRGAACSLGVGKHGYPPEVCAPASFSPSEAAEILGTYAQNKYAGLAKWALITGLPIDDIAVPLVPMRPRGSGKDPVPADKPRRQTAARAAKPRGKAPKKSAGGERSNKQVLDQVLLTVARI